MIKVLICDDHQLMIDGLSLILGEIEDILVVGQCYNGQEAVDWLVSNETDVILMDINMPVLDGIKACKIISGKHPSVKVIYLSMINQIEIFQVLVESGAKGFLLKNSSSSEVECAIKSIAKGELHFDPKLFNLSAENKPPQHFIPKLTKREKEILRLIITEYTSPEIAKKLFISLGTVETHRRNILSKMGVKNTAGLVRMAIEYRLV
ncbi:UNVERIFIED_CONTAM: hypothetical protein GTU68_030633 [Idotea baltica]|nr:hypothetical protein [Idotea baltica]